MEIVIASKFKSERFYWFQVINKVKKNNRYYYEVEFAEINGVKYKTIASKISILQGTVRNPYYPIVAGVGYLGNAKFSTNKKLYRRWQNMIVDVIIHATSNMKCMEPKVFEYVKDGTAMNISLKT